MPAAIDADRQPPREGLPCISPPVRRHDSRSRMRAASESAARSNSPAPVPAATASGAQNSADPERSRGFVAPLAKLHAAHLSRRPGLRDSPAANPQNQQSRPADY